MCGINFIFSLNKDCKLGQKDNNSIIRMNKLINYRGPDNSDYYFSDYVNFGHNRLSIVDDRDISNQPFISSSLRTVIIFNGEIYNFRSLRDKCLLKGYKFKTFSDTEVIVSLYEIWGIDGLNQIEGMFSFVIYDKENNKAIVRRDRFGIKPLYFFIQEEKLYGSSELKPLLKISKIKEINTKALTSIFLFDNNCFEESLISSIYKLSPGMQIIYSNFSFKKDKWFDINTFDVTSNIDKDFKFKFYSILENSIKKQAETDVPTCIFYSGGIDSSLISYYALKKNRDIKLFSFIPRTITNLNNDVLNAEKRASLIGAENFENLYFDDKNLFNYLDIYSNKMYEPTSDAAIIPTLFLSEIAREQGYKVALTGDGSDELFGGYSRYKFLSNYSRLFLIGKIFKFFNKKISKYFKFNPKIIRILNSLQSLDNPDLLYNQLLSVEDILGNLNDNFLNIDQKIKGDVLLKHASYLKRPKNINNYSLYDSISRADFINLLNNQYLPKVDSSTMSYGIEARVPFLDDEIVRFVFENRVLFPLPRMKTKPYINKISKKILPYEFSNIPKQGYGIPLRSWLSGPLLEYLNSINVESYETYGIKINPFKYKELLIKLNDNKKSIDYSILNKLWKIISISMWKDNLLKL